MKSKVEILAPAGSYESLRAAVKAGADAVYMGGSRFGARAYADNPQEEQLLEAIDYAHIHGRKIYLTVNTLLKDREMEELHEYLLPYYLRGIDGVIVQDIGVIEYISRHFKDLPVHASTQMTITGVPGAQFLKKQGVSRIVPARELSLKEIQRLKSKTGLEIECFVHGALCYCYSGQCLFSSLAGGRSGNRGQCAQPCRLSYRTEGRKPEDLMSLKDLCAIDLLPELIGAGIDSFKIEGRMKQPEYVYTVVGMYRKYADMWERCLVTGNEYAVSEKDRQKLLSAYRRRGYTDGYFLRHNGREMISFARPEGMEPGPPKQRDYKIQEKIKGNLILSPGKHATLILYKDGTYVSCAGDVVQPAKKQPLDKDRVKKQMEKTGATQYCFERLEIQMEEDCFLPMQSLNALRREAVLMLTEELLKSYRREAVGISVPYSGSGFSTAGSKEDGSESAGSCASAAREEQQRFSLAVSVSEPSQLEAVLERDDISTIYIDSAIGCKAPVCAAADEAGRKGRRLYIAMPYICREEAFMQLSRDYAVLEETYDGVLVRNFESYEWLVQNGYQKDIRSDSGLYLFNQYSRRFLCRTAGISSYTAPAELNARELKTLGTSDCTLPVYGYQPVMITANCIRQTLTQCTGSRELIFISDGLNHKFAVKNCCEYCYNIIYNCKPLMLLDEKDEILRLGPMELRLDFTTEGPEKVREILNLYTGVFLEGKECRMEDAEFTRGHFKRGVK